MVQKYDGLHSPQEAREEEEEPPVEIGEKSQESK